MAEKITNKQNKWFFQKVWKGGQNNNKKLQKLTPGVSGFILNHYSWKKSSTRKAPVDMVNEPLFTRCYTLKGG